MPGSPTICTNHGLPAPSRSSPRSSSASSLARPTRTRDRLPAVVTHVPLHDPTSPARATWVHAAFGGQADPVQGSTYSKTPYTRPNRRLAASKAADTGMVSDLVAGVPRRLRSKEHSAAVV